MYYCYMNDRMQKIRAAEKADPLYGRTAARDIVEGGDRTRNVRRRIQRLVESGDFTHEQIAKKIRPDLEKLGLIAVQREEDTPTPDARGEGEVGEKEMVPNSEESDPIIQSMTEDDSSIPDAIGESETAAQESVPSNEKSDPIIRSIKDVIRRVADVVCDPEKRKNAAVKVHKTIAKKHRAATTDARNKKLEESGMFAWTPQQVAYFKKLLNDPNGKYYRPISKRTKTRRYNHTALCWAMNAKFNTLRFDEDVTRNKLDSMNSQIRKEKNEEQQS